jgi:hypothetical protein
LVGWLVGWLVGLTHKPLFPAAWLGLSFGLVWWAFLVDMVMDDLFGWY